MKIRNGFVSNSSSSSFVCDVCHGVESGWDMGLSDAEVTECEVGHVFCDSHMKELKKKVTLKDKQAKVLKWLEEIGEDDEDILEGCKSGDEGSIDDTYDEMLQEKGDRYNCPKDQCPCCQLITPTDDDLIRYLLYCDEQTKEEVCVEMKNRFGTLDEMDKVIPEAEKRSHINIENQKEEINKRSVVRPIP